MKFTEAQQRRILAIRANASAVLQESENSAADLIASLVQRALDDLATYIERNPTLNVDAALQALATAIDHVTEGATDIMLALAEEAFDVALVSGAAALNEFGVLSPDVIQAAAQSFEAEFRRDLLTDGHAAWYERLSTEALNPRGPMREVIDSVGVAGESWSTAAKRLANADPEFSYLPTRNIDAYARAREIVRTESTRIDNAVSVGFSESAGIKTFQNIGVGDTRQSKICRDASNEDPKSIEEWARSRFGAPPRHPNCRCVLLGVYSGFAPDGELLQGAGVVASDRRWSETDAIAARPVATQTLFHGTDATFDTFSPKHIGSSTDAGFLGKGFYFSTDPKVASNRKIRLEVSANINNPLRLHMESWSDSKQKLVRDALGLPLSATAESVTEKARSLGYDSVILDYSRLKYNHQEVAVFSAKKLKIKDRRIN